MDIEVEKDMRVFHIAITKGKQSISDYLNKIAAMHPLLGTAIISDKNFKVIEKKAREAIKLALDYRKLKDFAYLAIFLTVIQYAKSWDYAESSGFWAYISEQLGYKYSQPLYSILTESVKKACECYNRVFLKASNGDNSYYSTVLAHAIAPNKSFFALCDFLLRFYKNNLDCSVYPGDPAIDRMVEVLRDRCNGATIEQDDDIRGNVGGIQVGIRTLLLQRSIYMRTFLAKLLQKIDLLLSGDELDKNDYTNVLLTQWYAGKITETIATRSAPVHKHTTDIAFSYGKVRIGYILDEDGEPALQVPSIRLNTNNNPTIVIYSGNVDIYRQSIGIYGNDYACTSEETIIPFSDLCDVDFLNMRVELTVDGKQIYSSEQNLGIGALLFRDNKSLTSRMIDEGNYLLFAPKSVSVTFQGDVERQRRPYFAQLYDVYLQGEASVYVNSTLLCCSRPPIGSLRFKLQQSSSDYVVDGIDYPIYARSTFSIAAVGQFLGNKLFAMTDNGDILSINSEENDVYSVEIPVANGCHTVSLNDGEPGRILDEVRFCLTDTFEISFDRPYYFENSDDGTLWIKINGEKFEVPLTNNNRKAKFRFKEGEIVVQIPRIKLFLDGQSLPKSTVWRGAISPPSKLWVNCTDTLNVSLSLGENTLLKADIPSGFEYAIGNAVQAVDETTEKQSVDLFIEGNRHHLFDIAFKPCLISTPLFNLNRGVLKWLNPQCFIGDSATKLRISFRPKHGIPITIFMEQSEHILSNNFPELSEQYKYEVSAITDTTFGKSEVCISKNTIIFGNRSEVIFRGETLRVSRVIEEGNFVDIKPFFIEKINFIGKENLGYTDLCGEYPHYVGKLFFLTRNGKRYFDDLNPVDIYLVNENAGFLHITFDRGEGLFIDKRSEYMPELFKHRDPPPKFARFFTFPDYFEYK